MLGRNLNGLGAALQIPPDVIKRPVASPLVVFHGKMLLLVLKKVYKYDIQACKLEKIPLVVEDFMCYDRENNMYQTYSKKEVMDFHLFNYVESLVSIRKFWEIILLVLCWGVI